MAPRKKGKERTPDRPAETSLEPRKPPDSKERIREGSSQSRVPPKSGSLPPGYGGQPSLPPGFSGQPSQPSLPPGFSGQARQPSLPPGFSGQPSQPSGYAGQPSLPPGYGGPPGYSSSLPPPPVVPSSSGPMSSSMSSGGAGSGSGSGDAAPSSTSFKGATTTTTLSISGSSSSVRPARRPGYGQAGKRIIVYANHFKVELRNMAAMNVFHYDVALKAVGGRQREVPKALCRAVVRQVIAENHAQFGGTPQRPALPVYDGSKSLYSIRQLPFTQESFETVLAEESGRTPSRSAGSAPTAGRSGSDGKERRFEVTIKQAAAYTLEAVVRYMEGKQADIPQEIIQALDIAMRETPSQLYIPSGRSFYSADFPNSQMKMSGGLASWRGFFQSLRLTQQGLALNLDVAATAFYQPMNVADFAASLLPPQASRLDANTRLRDSDRVKVKRALTKLKVTVNHRNTPRRYRITGLTRETAGELTFQKEENGPPVYLTDYFWETYQYRIRYLGLPCVTVGGRTGSCLPMECCDIIPGQKYVGKLNDRQTSEMIKMAAGKPQQRSKDLMAIVQQRDVNRDRYLAEFGMRVDVRMTEVQARILDPPKLQYGRGHEVQVNELRRGAWNLMGGQSLSDAKPLQHWALISFSPSVRDRELHDIQMALSRRCTELGMQTASPVVPPVFAQERFIEAELQKLQKAAQAVLRGAAPLQLIVIVLPRRDTFYGVIKRLCDTVLNVPTQCCLADNIRKCQSQYLANLAFKMNIKLGGQNVRLANPAMAGLHEQEATLVMGADVTHPSPGDDNSPSIAAVVANMDVPWSYRYRCLLSAQAHRQEVIQGLHNAATGEGMFKTLLVEFYRTSIRKRKPQRIIYFRDGVGEGQFKEVLFAELRAMQMACHSLEEGYRPKFTVVVVQKKHHTRCFASDNNCDRNGNLMPGTVIDRSICSPVDFDFYMYSHAGIQGTTRPTHYQILWDDNGFNADQLQTLVHALSFTYARCTRSVSLVAPAYYADLAAARARLYLDSSSSASGSERGGRSESSGGGASSRYGAPPVPQLPTVGPLCREGMFFC